MHEKIRPIVGVSSTEKGNFAGWFETFHLHETRADASYAVSFAGGNPIIIPAMLDSTNISQTLDLIDGLFITGGYDVVPRLYGEDLHRNSGNFYPMTDRYDILLLKEAFKRKMPVLCVCRGVQIANVAYKGTLYQDIFSEKENVFIKHSAPELGNMFVHKVNIEDTDSLFTKITNIRTDLEVNSIHHQAIKELAPIFKVVGRSNDDIIEIIELKDGGHFFLGLQFHPEILATRGHVKMEKIFKAFVTACDQYKQTKGPRNSF